MTSRAEVPGWIRSWTPCLKSSLMSRSPAAPRAAPMIPPATPVSGASGNRNSSPISVAPEQAAEAAPGGLVVDGGRDVQLSLLVAADDGRLLTGHQGVTTRWLSTLATPGAAAAAALAAVASLMERTCP